MLQKIGSYYLGVFKKYGVVIPAILLIVAYAIMISLEATDAIGIGLLKNNLPVFIVLACIAGLVFVGGIVYSVLKLNNKEIGIHDLGLTLVSILTVLMLVMYAFENATSLFTTLKWIITAVVTVVCVIVSVLRAKKVN